MDPENLTAFGKELSNASKAKVRSFSSATKDWPVAYASNYELIQRLKGTISKKQNVLVLGAGYESRMASISKATDGWLRTGVHWTNFHPEIQVDVMTSTHTCTLEAALYAKKEPLLLIHGVYSKVPPILRKSFTVRWSDPYFGTENGVSPSAQYLEMIIRKKAVGPAPYIPSVRNTLFLNVMIMIWLGAKKIVFTGVDPFKPEYFFSRDQDIVLEIVRCLSMCDPWLAEWDGRNERLTSYDRETAHRIQQFIKNICSVRSAVGEKKYVFEFDRGFKLLKNFAAVRGVELGYVGDSTYMQTTEISRID